MKRQLTSVLVCLALGACSTSNSTPDDQTPNTEPQTSVEEPAAPKEDPNVATIKKVFEVMNAERRGTPEFFAEDATMTLKHSALAPPEPIGPEGMKAINEQSIAMSSDIQARPLRIFVLGGNRYLVEVYMTGTFDGKLEPMNAPPIEPTNKRIGMTMLQDTRFNDEGKVQHIELWRNEMAMLIQLGVMPSPMNRAPVLPDMPVGETEVVHVDETPNAELVGFFEKFEESFQARPWDREATAAMLADDVKMGTPPRAEVTKERYLEDSKMFANGLTEMSYEIHESWTAGDIVVVHVTGRATQTGDLGPFKATNKKVENHFVDIFQVKDGKAVAFSGYGNPLNALKQLGHFPPKQPQAKK